MAVKRPRAGVHYPRDFDEFLKLFTSEEDLDEYSFRFNRRYLKNRGMLFYRLIEQAVVTPPHPDKDLVA